MSSWTKGERYMSDTISSLFLRARDQFGQKDALRYRHKKRWLTYSWVDYFQTTEACAGSLMAEGVQRGDRVIIMSNTRMEWACADMAILGMGGISVPVYQSNRAEEAEYIIKDCEARVLICEDKSQVRKWQSIANSCPSIQQIVCLDTYEDMPPEVWAWDEWLDRGRTYIEKNPSAFIDEINKTGSDEVATIIYTSGTTGQPKGVVLTHRQIMSEIEDVFNTISIDSNDITLSFLPYAHVLGRVEAWGSVYCGYTLAFAESIEAIRRNILQVRPTVIIGVPRIFEKIYNGVITQVEANPVKHHLFQWALDIGRRVSQYRQESRSVPLTLITQYEVAKRLVFSSIKEKLGGRLRFAVSGGAPLSKEIGEFFHAADILILEGYGLTETTAAVTLNTPFAYRFGTVGRPLPDVSIRIAEDGEVLIKSDKVMKEYYKSPEATKQVFIDGYFCTGDVGELTKDGFLRITDRKKDLIKTAGGKYVAPQKLESLLKLDKHVSQALIHGDQRKYIVALVTLNQEQIIDYARRNDISFQDYVSLSQHPLIRELVRDAVAEANSHLASYESIKNFAILPKDFTIEDGELTPSMKVKRSFCDKKYKRQLDELYGEDKGRLL